MPGQAPFFQVGQQICRQFAAASTAVLLAPVLFIALPQAQDQAFQVGPGEVQAPLLVYIKVAVLLA